MSVTVIVGAVAIIIMLFMQKKTFGKNPSGERLKKIENSVNYKDGSFQNLSPTSVMLEDVSYFEMFRDFINKPKNVRPQKPIPSVKTNLKTIESDKPLIIWFGHSSYLLKSKGKTILVDPVFSGYASPVFFFGKSFEGTDVYNTEDLPMIDAILFTHDHYDHLDFETVSALKSKTNMFYAPLGVGAHLEHWGVDPRKIIELDWWDAVSVMDQIEITAAPTRHFSGRALQRGKTLWTSYILKLDGYTLYIGGDSGYDAHFKDIGNKHGPFDLAILESGQYGINWPNIHLFPEQVISAAEELNAKALLPVHWGKFALSNHAWNEPIIKLVEHSRNSKITLVTPLIGEPVILDSLYKSSAWWDF